MHSFLHTVASRALLAARALTRSRSCSVIDANVTPAVYIREVADARRRNMRGSRMVAEFGDVLADRVANVLTSWELRHEDDAPRLVTAYIDE